MDFPSVQIWCMFLPLIDRFGQRCTVSSLSYIQQIASEEELIPMLLTENDLFTAMILSRWSWSY